MFFAQRVFRYSNFVIDLRPLIGLDYTKFYFVIMYVTLSLPRLFFLFKLYFITIKEKKKTVAQISKR